jgi:hypothetical protein
MKKIIAILFTAFLVSCGNSVVSSRDAIVKKIEINNNSKNPEKYRIYAEYLEGPLYISDITDARSQTNEFELLTDTKYNVGDTINLSK